MITAIKKNISYGLRAYNDFLKLGLRYGILFFNILLYEPGLRIMRALAIDNDQSALFMTGNLAWSWREKSASLLISLRWVRFPVAIQLVRCLSSSVVFVSLLRTFCLYIIKCEDNDIH